MRYTYERERERERESNPLIQLAFVQLQQPEKQFSSHYLKVMNSYLVHLYGMIMFPLHCVIFRNLWKQFLVNLQMGYTEMT